MGRVFLKILCTFMLLSSSALVVLAQSDVAQVSGQVTDPQGLAVSNAAVTLVNLATSEKQETEVDATGRYAFTNLMPGQYQLTLQVTGFTDYTSESITLKSGDALPYDIKLSVA